MAGGGDSPYAAAAAKLRDQGYSAMPVSPGTKIPGEWRGNAWRPMPGWQKYCDAPAPDFLHDTWERWPDAGVCIAHGTAIGLDLDTDRKDVEAALLRAVEPPSVRRRGRKGWLGYFRPGSGLESVAARVRWYDPKNGPEGRPVVELLLHGTQSVLPPTIHPDTGQPYAWLTLDTLETVPPDELPELGGAELARIDHELVAIGLTRQAPRKAASAAPLSAAGGHDLEKPFWRSFNDRAMEAMDQWFPALGLPKTRQRGPGRWEAVAAWRGSGSGRSLHDRNPNLKATAQGIVDFGADRAYTPVDLVQAARDCGFDAAADWLRPYLRPEDGGNAPPLPAAATPPPEAEPVRDIWAPAPVFPGERSFSRIKPAIGANAAEYRRIVPDIAPDFPIRSVVANCPGLLGQVADFIDAASATSTEAGALAVAVPLLGALMGRAYETQTGLRTNIYTVAIGASGSGKTSLVKPAKELLTLARAGHILGADRIKSGTGLLRMLEGNQPKITFLDEFGHMLKQIGSPGAGSHAKEIITEFTALYSAANTIFTGSAYATQDARAIEYPHLCLFGMATPDQFWSAFGSASLEDGSVARYLVFPIGQSGPKEPDKTGQADIVEGITGIAEAVRARATGNVGQAPCLTVTMDPEAERARQALITTMDACATFSEDRGLRGSSILRRVAENAAKIALVSAVGRDPRSPVISAADFAIGHALARWSAVTMINGIASHIADNQIERDVNAVERFIKDGGNAGRLWRDVQRRFRSIRARDLRDIVDDLEQQGIMTLEISPPQFGGHPVKRLRIAGSNVP